MKHLLNNLTRTATLGEQVEFLPPASGGATDWIVLCDFDGTISLCDVTDALLQQFGRPGCAELEADWEAGRIGSRQCMSGQIALLDASPDELDAALAQINIDPSFKDFAIAVQAHGIPLHIVSDGLDYAIHSILRRHGLGELPVFANHLAQSGERRWALQFPYATNDCRKASGHCKCAHVARQRQQWGNVLYVGDGSSDYCVSHQVDLVLAKHKLIDYCTQQHIAHHAISSFAQAQALLPTLLAKTLVAA